jgi:hypothetical protein
MVFPLLTIFIPVLIVYHNELFADDIGGKDGLAIFNVTV